jgi:hypothetical protein
MKPANYAPVYAAALYPAWAEIARQHGYALAVHGSLARDFDLICIPWGDEPKEPQAVIDAIKAEFAVKEVGGPPSEKPHGRVAYTLSIGFGECFADLSFMPRNPGVLVGDGSGEALPPFSQDERTAPGSPVVQDATPSVIDRLINGDELRRLLAGVGVVGQIDGHDVVRRTSVLELVERRIREAQDAPGVAPCGNTPWTCGKCGFRGFWSGGPHCWGDAP